MRLVAASFESELPIRKGLHRFGWHIVTALGLEAKKTRKMWNALIRSVSLLKLVQHRAGCSKQLSIISIQMRLVELDDDH